MELAHVQGMTVLAVGIIFGMGALGSSRAPPASRNWRRCCR